MSGPIQQSGGALTSATAAALQALLATQGIITQGNVWWVRPHTGPGAGAGGDGKTPQTAFKTLAEALAAAVASQNDVILLCAEGNTASQTTSYQNATLAWNKDMVHLVGINAGGHLSQRSRVAFSAAYAGAGPLFSVTANGCLFLGIEFFAGVASAAPKGCIKVTGARNHFVGCHIAGIGNDAMDTADAYSLWLSAAQENLFESCEIGLDTIGAGSAANRELYVDGQSARNEFRRCTLRRLLDHASNHPLVELKDATSIDRDLTFVDCLFLQFATNYAIAAGQVMKIPAITQGYIVAVNCFANSSDGAAGTAPKWDVNDGNHIAVINNPTPAADTCGVGRQV